MKYKLLCGGCDREFATMLYAIEHEEMSEGAAVEDCVDASYRIAMRRDR